MLYSLTLICRHVSDPALAVGAMTATPEASSGQVPEAGSGQALQGSVYSGQSEPPLRV
jgi:hypothetical protein